MKPRPLNMTPKQVLWLSAGCLVVGAAIFAAACLVYLYPPQEALLWFLGLEVFAISLAWASIDWAGWSSVSRAGTWFEVSIVVILIAVVAAQWGTHGEPFPTWGVVLFIVSGLAAYTPVFHKAITNFQRWRRGEFEFSTDEHAQSSNWFGGADMASDEETQQIADEWYERKTALMVESLGEEHDIVMHAMIPYAIGGGLDLYFFPNGIPGTAFVTKELSELPSEGSTNDVYDRYELVMFTKQPLDLEQYRDTTKPFGQMYRSINAILNCIAPYSAEAALNPNETCEFPHDMEDIGGRCLIFDGYASRPDKDAGTFGLLCVIEIFPTEMNYAREHGGANLLERLKQAGHYPYSDMDRAPVA